MILSNSVLVDPRFASGDPTQLTAISKELLMHKSEDGELLLVYRTGSDYLLFLLSEEALWQFRQRKHFVQDSFVLRDVGCSSVVLYYDTGSFSIPAPILYE